MYHNGCMREHLTMFYRDENHLIFNISWLVSQPQRILLGLDTSKLPSTRVHASFTMSVSSKSIQGLGHTLTAQVHGLTDGRITHPLMVVRQQLVS